MPFSVQISSAAQKEILKLEARVQRRVKAKIEALASNPRPMGAIKLQSSTPLYRIRDGDYRVVYQINDASLIVLVVKVADRKDVYG
jgi:mRNA interferase RelE/StbE